mgnify:CR=1 FL=1
MKKIIAILMACLFVLSFATAFAESEKTLSIVCATFPQYDWVRQILGDRADDVDLTLLLDNGVDLHNYQPTADDIIKIAQSDLFIYVGGESDGWVDDVLATAQNPNLKAVSMLESVEAKEEETVEGMQEEEHDHDHAHDEAFTEADIEDRTLADFAGEWVSLWPMMKDGELEEYCAHKAEDAPSMTAEDYREKYIVSWACNVKDVSVTGNSITFNYLDGTTASAEYRYAGFATKTSDSGKISVRYQFETDSVEAPKYVQFNDHGHEPGAAEHFHLYFGNNGFDALMESTASSYFAPASLDKEGILEMLMGHEHEVEYDEHVWLSLRNAETLTQTITNVLCELDSANAPVYQENAANYIAKLNDLDNQYKDAVANGQRTTILFADRFPFRYLADDYGLTYYAAFVGCSAETEASFETIAFLAKKVDELKLPVVLTIVGANHAIAETVVSSTQAKNQKILTMNSIQSVTESDIADGASYLGIMTENLVVLKEALN